MPETIKGQIPAPFYAIQPDFTLTEKNDGTIDGNVVMIADKSNLGLVPGIGSTHPTDTRCECYTREVAWIKNNRVRVTNSYFGLVSRKTDPIVNYTPNTNSDPITSHPDFADMAGTADSPNEENGAKWDKKSGAFLGFFDPGVPDLFGVEYYLSPASLLTLSYWTSRVPALKSRMTIQTDVDGFKKPADVAEFMLLDTPYRQVGNFYQVTEQWMGSGPNGFSRTVYPQ